MGALSSLFHSANLQLAWRWVLSNPDARYKHFFRESYQNFEVIREEMLQDLAQALRRQSFHPTQASKILLPKKSGILRPFSLLTVTDQIAYQAFANLIAEALIKRVHVRYNRETFGHLYAGKQSRWFYRKWQDGYRAFGNAARSAYYSGLKWTASFDLTAYYDSLDHRVLSHYLEQLGFDLDFCGRLTDYLRVWTATEHQVFHGHGIPQGPLSSGLLSEVVLQHFDQHYGDPATVKYLRYVDDIRLFAASPDHLRRMDWTN